MTEVKWLEDLSSVLQQIIIEMATPPHHGTVVYWTHRHFLHRMGLITVDDESYSYLTERGAALVADWQARQQNEAINPHYLLSLAKQLGVLPNEKMAQEVMRASEQIADLQAVNEKLMAENKRLRECVDFTLIKLTEIDKRGAFFPSDFFTITDIIHVLSEAKQS